MFSRLALRSSFVLAVIAFAGVARAEEPAPAGPNEAQVQAFLAAKPVSADVSKAPAAPEVPPPPPRKRGFVLETSVGMMGHVGALRHVSPTSPWIRGAFGWEPTKWLMLLAQGDLAFGSTAYANPPPDPRTFAIWGLSGALRLGLQPTPSLGLYLQGEAGATRVTEDVLAVYGFPDSTDVAPYFGGILGVEWYQVNPHVGIVFQGGARSYSQLLNRTIGGDTALAWIGAVGLKYTF